MTGTVDRIADGAQEVSIDNGHPLMARVTAMGCAASALVGAFVVHRGRHAGRNGGRDARFRGGGRGRGREGRADRAASRSEFIDALYALDADTLAQKARVK